MNRHPHPLIAIIPLAVLIGLLAVVITLFGSDSLSGGSQVALIMGLAVCVFISMVFYKMPWKAFEQQMTKTLGGVAVTVLILLAVGMLSGSWMVSGVVPTLIYYGVQLLSPQLHPQSTPQVPAEISPAAAETSQEGTNRVSFGNDLTETAP